MTSQTTVTTDDANQAVEHFREFWSAPDPTEPTPHISPQIVGRWPDGRILEGIDAYRSRLMNIGHAIPDIRLQVLDHAVNRDSAFIRWRAHSTRRGSGLACSQELAAQLLVRRRGFGWSQAPARGYDTVALLGGVEQRGDLVFVSSARPTVFMHWPRNWWPGCRTPRYGPAFGGACTLGTDNCRSVWRRRPCRPTGTGAISKPQCAGPCLGWTTLCSQLERSVRAKGR